MNFEKIGGLASIVEVFLSVFLIVAIFILFPRIGLVAPDDWADPVKNIAAWEESPTTFYLIAIDLVLWSLTFVVLVLSLRNRLWNGTPNLMILSVIGASIAATLWLSSGALEIAGKEHIALAKDLSAFRVMNVTSYCLMSAGDFAFGWVLLLIGFAGIKTARLPHILNWILVVEGACFILDQALDILGFLGLILAIASNLWLGIILISSKTNADT